MSARREGPTDNTAIPILEPSRTQRVPAGMIRASSSLHVSVVGGDEQGDSAFDDPDFSADFADVTTPSLARPQIVVMEEKPLGLVDGLTACGFHVRAASSGLEAMTLVTQHQVVAVVIAPGDAERRRVLTVALRQRHRAVAVIHVLPRIDDASKRAAAIVGASGVLSWPLPLIDDVLAVIPLSLPATPASSSSLAPFADETGEVPVLSADASAINSDEAITNLVRRAKSSSDVFAASPTSPASLPKKPPLSPVVRTRVAIDDDDDDDGDNLATAPRLRASAQSLADPVAAAEPEAVATLLAAIPALLPLLADSASFLEALQVHHVRGAEAHARAIHHAVRLLTQMYTQLDGGDVD